jgi:transcriptional regulator with XRE-family HTH domain
MDVVKLLGLNVRDLRRQQRLSQEELAHRAEMDRSYVSDLERGTRNPSVKALGRLAEALGVRPDELLRSRQRPS